MIHETPGKCDQITFEKTMKIIYEDALRRSAGNRGGRINEKLSEIGVPFGKNARAGWEGKGIYTMGPIRINGSTPPPNAQNKGWLRPHQLNSYARGHSHPCHILPQHPNVHPRPVEATPGPSPLDIYPSIPYPEPHQPVGPGYLLTGGQIIIRFDSQV